MDKGKGQIPRRRSERADAVYARRRSERERRQRSRVYKELTQDEQSGPRTGDIDSLSAGSASGILRDKDSPARAGSIEAPQATDRQCLCRLVYEQHKTLLGESWGEFAGRCPLRQCSGIVRTSLEPVK